MSALSFSTFWYGPSLSALDRACLASFAARGHTVNLYSYAPIPDLPQGVILRDAREVVEESYILAYIVNGKPSVSNFTDLFRFALFRHEQTIWIDTDLVLLGKPFAWDMSKRLIAKEDEANICAAIMHIPQEDPVLAPLVEHCKGMTGVIRWAEFSKFAMVERMGRENILRDAPEPDVFYPVHYDEFWKVFLPEYRDECAALARNAQTLHLWNNLVEECGIWKDFGPPEGSYLHHVLEQAGVLHCFKDFYPEKVMRALVTNFVLSRTGERLGFVRLARLVPHALKTTFRHRVLKDFTHDYLGWQKRKSYLADKD